MRYRRAPWPADQLAIASPFVRWMVPVLLTVLSMRLAESAVAETFGNLHVPGSFADRYSYAIAEIARSARDSVPDMNIRVVIVGEEQETQRDLCASSPIDLPNQSYSLTVSGDNLTVCSASEEGALHGLSHLESLWLAGPLHDMQQNYSPAFDQRVLHFMVRAVSMAQFRDIIRRARLARFNTLALIMSDGIAFDSTPQKVRSDALTKLQLSTLCDEARASGFRLVAEIKLLTHQQVFLGSARPDLMYNKRTYDPRKHEVYEIVGRYLDEVIETVKPYAIHIGHDEVQGIGKAAKQKLLNPGERPLPADLFLQDILELHKMISARGLEIWMWGDMLVPRRLLPEILQRNWAERSGFPLLIDKLPHDIVINDWRYFEYGDFPSSEYFHDHGFRVYGATWYDIAATRAFAHYLSTRSWKADGMIATTWYLLPRGQWETVYEIIDQSGAAYWNGD